MSKEVTIIVAGRPAQGKSSIVRMIQKALKAQGVCVRVFDNMNDTDEVLEAGAEVNKTNVLIKTVTTSRDLELVS